jgi:creatinine amidohydrolase
MSRPSYALENLTWPEVGRILARDSRLIFPVGALEQHGPHLPLGSNTYIAERLSRDLSDDLGILLAPTLPYGVTLNGRGRFAGTATLRRKTLHRTVNELLASWEDHGVTETVIVTAYRYEPHLDALLMALTAKSETTVIDLYAIDVSDLLDAPPETEHGGELETSLMLHLAPERVRLDQIADFVPEGEEVRRYMRGRVPTPPAGSRGAVGRSSSANAEKGRLLYERYLVAVRAALTRSQEWRRTVHGRKGVGGTS